MSLTEDPHDPTMMPCPACTVLDCTDCRGTVDTMDGITHPCPCKAAGHEGYLWPDEDDYLDFAE